MVSVEVISSDGDRVGVDEEDRDAVSARDSEELGEVEPVGELDFVVVHEESAVFVTVADS